MSNHGANIEKAYVRLRQVVEAFLEEFQDTGEINDYDFDTIATAWNDAEKRITGGLIPAAESFDAFAEHGDEEEE